MTEHITAIAVDDEPNALEIIKMHSNKVSFLNLQHCFRDPIEAVEWLRLHSVDMLFLDINMPDLSGLQFRKIIGNTTSIIFTTAYPEFGAESYESDALDYLVKPIVFERFLKAVLKYNNRQRIGVGESIQLASAPKPAKSQLFIKSGRKRYSVNIHEIFYLKKDGNYVEFHMPNKKILSRLNMEQVQALLPENKFFRVHKSYIIALEHIDSIEVHQVMVKGISIPIAKSYRKKLWAWLEA